MKTIKFSHNYPKLWNQTDAKLIGVTILPLDFQLDKDLIEYDTKTSNGEYYKLPKATMLIQLIFIGNKLIPFCTLRRYTPEKERYYMQSIGEKFSIDTDKVFWEKLK